jgi:GNAT superfamily N-acetyltransferase
LIEYRVGDPITPDQFVDVLRKSTLSERRPVDFPARIEDMLRYSNLVVTAWQDELLVGVARSITDFSFCCYLSDLAVDQSFQRQGIGRELIRVTRKQLGPGCTLILLAAPDARQFYPHIGFRSHESAWILKPGDVID